MSRLSRVFIEFIHPSIRELTAEKKGWWDIGSYANGWRHARLVVTTKPVPFISSDVQGDVYDAGKDPKSKLVPIYEKFTPTSLNRYLAVGPLKATINDDEIKRLLNIFITQNPNYEFTGNNCLAVAKALGIQIIDGSYPSQVKMKGAVYPLQLGAMGENFVKITVDDGFDDAVIYDPSASLTKDSVPPNVDDVIKAGKEDKV